MFIQELTTGEMLLYTAAAAVVVAMVLWLTPSKQVRRQREFSEAEITAYDRNIPRYFIAAALALFVGGVHMVVKNVPGFSTWLWEAGYGGHLFRDLANSHIIIVGGGTVMLTGITWYLLPRLVNRPLYSTALATSSLWFTVIGVFGFYIAWLVLGLIEGQMVREGWVYADAKAEVGTLHTMPTRITSMIMGIGYWTYILNVFLTIAVSRHVRRKPQGYLVKFVAVAAAGLWVGTVQGVLQVLPANADWIHAAGRYGEYVDPISHAHVNLVTGMIVSLAALLLYFGRALGGVQLDRRAASLVFWTLVPGSLLFYFAFLLLGLILGADAAGYGGLSIPELTPILYDLRAPILAVAGFAMLAGFWVYFYCVWRVFGLRDVRGRLTRGNLSAFWLVSTAALVIGTFQGLLQVIPVTADALTIPEEIPNVHAQLNMLGGVLLVLMGVCYLLTPRLTGHEVEQRLVRLSLYGVGGGVFAYYLATLLTGLARLDRLRSGLSNTAAAERVGWWGPLLLTATAVPVLVGFSAFGLGLLRATRAYRADVAEEWRSTPRRINGPMPERLKRVPARYIVGVELMLGLFGFPGAGWLFAGQALPGVALLIIGPGIAWAALPALFSPVADTAFSKWGWQVALFWLAGSAILSSALLALYIHRSRAAEPKAGGGSGRAAPAEPEPVPVEVTPQPAAVPAAPGKPAVPTVWSRIPRRLIYGAIFVFTVLFSIPVLPWVLGIPAEAEQQPLIEQLPDGARGAYLEMSDADTDGLLKLYTWSIPQQEIPGESPQLNPAHVDSIFIVQKGLDEPDKYMLFRDGSLDPIPVATQIVDFQHELRLIPLEPLAPGGYGLIMPTGGMFAGREYFYFSVDDATAELPPLYLASEGTATPNIVPDIPDEWMPAFPLAAFALSLWITLVMTRRLLERVRPHEAAWAVAFGMFAAAAGAQVAADLFGWSAFLARTYYINGATLVVGWLGLGTWLLTVRRPALQRGAVLLMLLLTGYGIGLISLTPVNSALLAGEGWGALEQPAALTALTISLNTLGTVALVGGALWSAWSFYRRGIMRERMVGCVLLAVGSLVVASGGTLTRLGHDHFFYVAMTAGVGLMFWGFRKTIAPVPRPVATPPRLAEPLTGEQLSHAD